MPVPKAAFLVTLLAGSALLLAGCNGGSDAPVYPVTIQSDTDTATLFTQVDTLELPAAGVKADGTRVIISLREKVKPELQFHVNLRKLTYPFKDNHDKARTLSGMLVTPRPSSATAPMKAPILLYNHGTILTRVEAPSRLVTHPIEFMDLPEPVIGVLFARAGYIVAMADYSGLGDDATSLHPYMHMPSAVKAVLGMFEQTQACLNGRLAGCEDVPSRVQWDGRIFVMGYSQGGAVTLGTARELQALKANVRAVAAGASPCDLSGAMRDKMLEKAVSKAPFFLPYVIMGYREAYDRDGDGNFNPNGLFEPKRVFDTPWIETWKLFDGVQKAKDVNPKLPPVPRDIMSETLKQDLQVSNSQVMQLLRDNETWQWMPTMPLILLHHPQDDLVPYANSQNAYNFMKSAPESRFADIIGVIEELDSIHAGAAPLAFWQAYVFMGGHP
ncbi:MAG: hypothetical protein U1F10_07575 [Burkholderiales bacterium]